METHQCLALVCPVMETPLLVIRCGRIMMADLGTIYGGTSRHNNAERVVHHVVVAMNVVGLRGVVLAPALHSENATTPIQPEWQHCSTGSWHG